MMGMKPEEMQKHLNIALAVVRRERPDLTEGFEVIATAKPVEEGRTIRTVAFNRGRALALKERIQAELEKNPIVLRGVSFVICDLVGDNAIESPAHYAEGREYEPKDVIRDWGLNFNLGNVVKYVSRAGRKDDVLKDLRKARQYLDFEIEAIYADRRCEHKAFKEDEE